MAKAWAHLFAPEPALRVLGCGKGGNKQGQTPPLGAIIDYELAAAGEEQSPFTMEVRHDGQSRAGLLRASPTSRRT